MIKYFSKKSTYYRINLIKQYRLNKKQKIYLNWFENQKKYKSINLENNNDNKKNRTPLYITNYYYLMNLLLKKGKKFSIESSFKKSLKFWIKNFSNKNFSFILTEAFKNLSIHVGVITKRKGSKNIYIPYKLSKKRSLFLSSQWILKNAFIKKKKKFYESILEELSECALKTSNSIKKREESLKLVEENLNNLKKKI